MYANDCCLIELLVIHDNTWNHLTLLTYVHKSYISMYKEDIALNNLQWLICHKTKRNHLTVCKQRSFSSFKDNVTYKRFVSKSCIYLYKQDLLLSNLLGLICCKTQPTTKPAKLLLGHCGLMLMILQPQNHT